ncbi:MAG: phosphotransferase [Ilumatobacteraceae bacterium]
MTGLLHMLLPGYLERFTGRMSDDDLDVGRLLVERYGRWTELVTAWAEGPGDWCVTHGDYRLDNLLLGRSSGAPAVTVVDWQTVAVGIGPADVAYFVGAGLADETAAATSGHSSSGTQPGSESTASTSTTRRCGRAMCWAPRPGYLMAVIVPQLVEQTERRRPHVHGDGRRPAEQMREPRPVRPTLRRAPVPPHDDFPLHQTPEPFLHVGTDSPNAYDRFFFNGFDRAGERFFAVALGVYPEPPGDGRLVQLHRRRCPAQRARLASPFDRPDRHHGRAASAPRSSNRCGRTASRSTGRHGVAADLTVTGRCCRPPSKSCASATSSTDGSFPTTPD